MFSKSAHFLLDKTRQSVHGERQITEPHTLFCALSMYWKQAKSQNLFYSVTKGPKCEAPRCYSPVVSMATSKEEATLLPISFPPTRREGRFLVSRAFCILHLLAFALLVWWLTLLTFQSWPPEAREEIIRQLVSSQEVRDPWFFNQITIGPSLGSWKEANGQ